MWSQRATGPAPMQIKAIVNDVPLVMELDTGASVSIIAAKVGPRESTLPLFVVKGTCPTRLGRDWMEAMKITISKPGEREGIIRPVKTSQRAAPVIPVVKQEGSVRLCGDFKININPATCLNVGLDEYNEYMKTGTSTFECSGCTRRHSLSPKVTGAKASTANDDFIDPEGESAAAQESPVIHAGVVQLIENLTNKVEILAVEFKCPRVKNRGLRSEALQLRETVLDRIPLTSPSQPRYASIAAGTPATHTPGLHAPPASARLPLILQPRPSSTVAHENQPGRSSSSSGTVSADENDFPPLSSGLRDDNGPNSASRVEDGFIPVKRRQRAKPPSGTAKPNKVNAVSPTVRRFALFVSRIDPNTSATDIADLVEPFLEGRTTVSLACLWSPFYGYPYATDSSLLSLARHHLDATVLMSSLSSTTQGLSTYNPSTVPLNELPPACHRPYRCPRRKTPQHGQRFRLSAVSAIKGLKRSTSASLG
ncbi:uncharacterized protein ISCGN_026414 [Ixodes scapularis]